MMVTVVVAVVLVNLPRERSHAGSCGSPNQGALQAPAEDSSQRSSTCTSDQGSLTGSDSAGVVVVIVMVVMV
jgi:hypothetical protein